MKKITILLILLVSVMLTACSGGSNVDGENIDTVTLKLSHVGSDTHPYHIASEKFKELVEEKTDGKVNIDIHDNGTLGGEAAVAEQLLDGTIDITVLDPGGALANTYPIMNVFNIPYLFSERDEVYNVLDGEVGEELMQEFDNTGITGLAWWELGFRNLTNSKKEIIEPEDADGLSIRTNSTPVWKEHMQSLGVTLTPIDFNELYSALDQGTIDGQENPLQTINSMKFYEVQPYISLTKHTYSPALVLISDNVLNNKLGEEEKNSLNEAADETVKYIREYLTKSDDEILKTLEEAGVTISEPNYEAFREATKSVEEFVEDNYASKELIEKIKGE